MTQSTTKNVSFFICPEPGCPSYFGSNSMPDLSQQFTGPKQEDRAALREKTGSTNRHSRAACPICRLAGKEVERMLVGPIPIAVSTEGPETPKLPAFR